MAELKPNTTKNIAEIFDIGTVLGDALFGTWFHGTLPQLQHAIHIIGNSGLDWLQVGSLMVWLKRPLQ